jgi:hypothetical protein
MTKSIKKGIIIMRSILLLFLLTISLYSNPPNNREVDDFFRQGSAYNLPLDGSCDRVCRPLKEPQKFITKIIDFDASTGVTSCGVYPKHNIKDSDKLSVLANTKDPDCAKAYKDIKVNYQDGTLASLSHTPPPRITINFDATHLTMSKFLGGMLAMDDDVVDIAQTVATGVMQYKNGNNVYTIPTNGSGTLNDRLLNVTDKISKENLAYFVNFVYDIDEITEYLSSYLLVFFFFFFLITYAITQGFKKSSGKATSHDTPVTARFFIAAVAFVFFFMPMRYDANYSSTIFQNVYKYFISESTKVADWANAKAMQTHLNKIHNTVGVNGVQSEASIKLIVKQQQFLNDSYHDILTESCDKRFSRTSYQITDPGKIEELESKVGLANTFNTISYRACRKIEKRNRVAVTGFDQADYLLKRIKLSYQNPMKLNQRLSSVDTFIKDRVDEVGWYSAILAPNVQFLTQLAYLTDDTTVPVPLNESERGKINEATEATINKMKDEVDEKGLFDFLTDSIDAQKKMGEWFASTAYFVVPSADAIYNFFEKIGSKVIMLLVGASVFLGGGVGGILAGVVASTASPIIYLMFTVMIIKMALLYLPLITTTIAVGIAILKYLYEMIIFTFIAPFMIIFALTMRSSHKIIDFLGKGVGLFVKPTLIVIGVYIALFIYGLFRDVFIAMIDEQFYLSLLTATDFSSSLVFYYMKELLFIFSGFATIYITWKIAIGFPQQVLDFFGDRLDNSTRQTQEMTQHFSRFGFQA